MSVIDRLNRLVRSNLNDLASRAAGRQMAGEVRRSLRDARSEMASLRAAERRIEKHYENLLDESQRWEERAMIALRADDDDLARRALLKKQEIDRRARGHKEELNRHRSQLIDLRRSLDAIEVKLDAVKDRGRSLAPSYRRSDADVARSARLVADAELGGLGDPSLFTEFDHQVDRLNYAGAEIEALKELEQGSATPDWTDVDHRFDDSDRYSSPQSFSSHSLDPFASEALEDRFRKLEADRQLKLLHQKAAASPPSHGQLNNLRRLLDEE